MADPHDLTLVRSVLHPTDFSSASELAFVHALAIALLGKTQLTILHAGGDRSENWQSFPSVVATLERWGVLKPGSPRSAVFKELAVRVKKIVTTEKNPVRACVGFAERHATDMIVLASRGVLRPMRWLKGSRAETVARQAQTVTLFVPETGRGFVSTATGRLSLERILVPIAHSPAPQPAVQFAARIARLAGVDVNITLLHVGDAEDLPEVSLPETEGVRWTTEIRQGRVPAEIVAEADRISANLVLMTTDGRDVLVDALRGSHTERVIRLGACPVMALPVAWSGEHLTGRPIIDVLGDEMRGVDVGRRKTYNP